VEKAFGVLWTAGVTKRFGNPEGELHKGMNNIRELADLFLQLAWLKWSVTQEQAQEEDVDSPLPRALEGNLAGLADTLVAMVGEETKEYIAAAADGKSPDECSTTSNNGCCAPVPMCCTVKVAGVDMLKASMSDEEVGQLEKGQPDIMTVDGVSLYKAAMDDPIPDVPLTICFCDCPPCKVGNHFACSNVTCKDPVCASLSCPAQPPTVNPVHLNLFAAA